MSNEVTQSSTYLVLDQVTKLSQISFNLRHIALEWSFDTWPCMCTCTQSTTRLSREFTGNTTRHRRRCVGCTSCFWRCPNLIHMHHVY